VFPMRYGKYTLSEHGNVGTAITFLLMGLGAGALVALLLAPKSGKQMRRDLQRKYEDARETLDDWKEEAKGVAEEAMERGAEIVEEVRDRVTPLTKAARRA
ncbi:MAG TPA: YtxH domain-containing protein, partial [Bryobacteraceae bacterium]|nr:YtxH domain-containing protein [Bryobacteraceae bacterium]